MVVFSVKAEEGRALGPFCSDTILKYNTVITNIGGAYNEGTGVFTAPIAGVYYFIFFYHAQGHQRAALVLYKNHQAVVMTSDHKSSKDTADNGGNAVFLKLEQGDEVSVRMLEGTHVWAGGSRTTFSGFLVSTCC